LKLDFEVQIKYRRVQAEFVHNFKDIQLETRPDDPQHRVRLLAAVNKKCDGLEADEEQVAAAVLYYVENR
jgi:hypothetical protein